MLILDLSFHEGRCLKFLHEKEKCCFDPEEFWHRGFKLQVFRHSDFTHKGFELDLFQITQTCGSRNVQFGNTAENRGLVHKSSPATGKSLAPCRQEGSGVG